MAGLDFVQAILSEQLPEGGFIYQGIACTQLRGYLLCIEAEAPSVDSAKALLNLDDKLQLNTKQSTK